MQVKVVKRVGNKVTYEVVDITSEEANYSFIWQQFTQEEDADLVDENFGCANSGVGR